MILQPLFQWRPIGGEDVTEAVIQDASSENLDGIDENNL
jgi:hypothetical protein